MKIEIWVAVVIWRLAVPFVSRMTDFSMMMVAVLEIGMMVDMMRIEIDIVRSVGVIDVSLGVR